MQEKKVSLVRQGAAEPLWLGIFLALALEHQDAKWDYPGSQGRLEQE